MISDLNGCGLLGKMKSDKILVSQDKLATIDGCSQHIVIGSQAAFVFFVAESNRVDYPVVTRQERAGQSFDLSPTDVAHGQ